MISQEFRYVQSAYILFQVNNMTNIIKRRLQLKTLRNESKVSTG